jgi:fido (protein-threonine AMPylation protein)
MFCLPQSIEPSAAEIFRHLRNENFLRGLDRDAFIDRLTYYRGEVNAVRPFREGNGRTQRAFFEQLTDDAGFTLAWQRSTEAAISPPPPPSCAATRHRCARCSMNSSKNP